MKNATLDIDYGHDLKHVIVNYLNNGDMGDDYESDGMGSGMVRFGRRIYYWSDSGSDALDTFDNVDVAMLHYWKVQADYYHTECKTCGEKVHNDSDSRYEHEKYECGEDVDDPTRYAVNEWSGIAWKVTRRYPVKGTVVAVMVGDDRNFTFGADELTEIAKADYCHECGQIGCQATNI